MTTSNLSTLSEKHLSDYELAKLACESHQAKVDIATRLFDKISNTVWFIAPNDRDLDDMIQLSMIEILKSLNNFQGRSSLETWAEKITIRRSFRFLRTRSKKDKTVLSGVDKEAIIKRTGEDNIVDKQFRDNLLKLLEQLNPDRKNVLILRFFYHYSIKEIAIMTNSPINTVRDRLKIGKKNLISLMKLDTGMSDFATELLK